MASLSFGNQKQKTVKQFDDFNNNFTPHEYLKNYYSEIDLKLVKSKKNEESAGAIEDAKNVGQENANILAFYAKTILPILKKASGTPATLFEVGGGATIYQFISIAPLLQSIYFTDYLHSNVASVQQWKGTNSNAWKKFILGSLLLEKPNQQIDFIDIFNREKLIKSKLKRWGLYDVIGNKMIKGAMGDEKFDIVSSNFCIESIANEKDTWQNSFANITGRIKKGGRLIITALKGAKSYKVADKIFPATEIYENDLLEMLKVFNFKNIIMQSFNSCDTSNYYQGMIMTTATLG